MELKELVNICSIDILQLTIRDNTMELVSIGSIDLNLTPSLVLLLTLSCHPSMAPPIFTSSFILLFFIFVTIVFSPIFTPIHPTTTTTLPLPLLQPLLFPLPLPLTLPLPLAPTLPLPLPIPPLTPALPLPLLLPPQASYNAALEEYSALNPPASVTEYNSFQHQHSHSHSHNTLPGESINLPQKTGTLDPNYNGSQNTFTAMGPPSQGPGHGTGLGMGVGNASGIDHSNIINSSRRATVGPGTSSSSSSSSNTPNEQAANRILSGTIVPPSRAVGTYTFSTFYTSTFFSVML